MLQIKNLCKSYNKRDLAVDHLNLEVRPGEIFGFLGTNGAGKTTTLKLITGILQADEGEISVNGFDIERQAIAAKRSMGFVSDDPNFLLRLKGKEYLKFMADIYEVPADVRVERISALARDFGMEKSLSDTLQSYSHGMRQKMVLMGALIHNPELWVLDEPMTGLDPQSAFILKQRMREHADAGKTVIFSTHVLEVAEKVCDRVCIINQGKMILCGTMEEIKAARGNESLEEIFLSLTANEELSRLFAEAEQDKAGNGYA